MDIQIDYVSSGSKFLRWKVDKNSCASHFIILML